MRIHQCEKDDLRTGINEDVISVNNSTTDCLIAVYAVARLSCIDCQKYFPCKCFRQWSQMGHSFHSVSKEERIV